MAYILEPVNLKGRDNVPGGAVLYIALHEQVTAVDVDVDDEYVSGITMSGSTKFVEILLPRENLNFTNGLDINIPNGTAVNLPAVTFNLPGLKIETLKLFTALVKKSVMVIIKGVDGNYWLLGKDNGLDATSTSNFTLGLASSDLMGSVIELTGLEASRAYQLDPTLAASIMTTIVDPA